jgi:hypothetical protein
VDRRIVLAIWTAEISLRSETQNRKIGRAHYELEQLTGAATEQGKMKATSIAMSVTLSLSASLNEACFMRVSWT